MPIFSPQKFKNSFRDFDEKPRPRKKINWKKIWNKAWRIGLWMSLAGFLFAVGVFAWFWKDLPSPENLSSRVVAESTKIYDRTGTHVLYEVHGEEKRTQIPYSEMPETVRFATIALEDQYFYEHYGIHFRSILRAVFKDIVSVSATQGASTITQQLIKNSMLTSDRTFTRKIKEVILAVEMETKFSKDEILEMYLNEIPYGSNAYGVEAAAQTFFGKHAKELDLPEAALLASLPQAPSRYSPYGSYPERLKARQEYALDQMKNLGYITEEQAKEAKAVDILGRIQPFREKMDAPHFVMYIRDYLEAKYGMEKIEKAGLRVYTTLDWEKQQLAEKVVREGAENNIKKYNAENAALVAIDPKTGQIISMVGSKDYFDKSIDGQVNVAIRDRQPGSSFKPFVYLTAFQKGYTPETNLWDVDTNFSTDEGKEYNPKNYDGKNRGLLKMKDALAMSLNVPAVKTLYLAGVKNAIENANRMGIKTLNNPDRYGLSLVLGGGEVKLLEHTNAFATLATGGIYREKYAILKIEDSSGEILEERKAPSGDRVIEEKHVAALDYVLSTNELRAPVFGENNPLRFDSRPVAAKTGTTNEWRDGWTMGYTPSLAVGVWAGNNDNSVMAAGADGSYVAAPIWKKFMEETLKNYPVEQFPQYEKEETGIDVLDGKLKEDEKVKVCELPGKDDKYCLYTDSCPKNLVDEKKFTSAHSILYYVAKDDPRGEKPENPENDPQFKSWEKAVRNYLKKEDSSDDSVPERECEAKDFDDIKPKISIASPSDGDEIASASFSVSVEASSDYGVDKITLEIEGQKVAEKDKSFSYVYTVPDGKKTDEIEIKAEVKDRGGNTESKTIKIKTNIP